MNYQTIPYHSGEIVVLGDLHYDSYRRFSLHRVRVGFLRGNNTPALRSERPNQPPQVERRQIVLVQQEVKGRMILPNSTCLKLPHRSSAFFQMKSAREVFVVCVVLNFIFLFTRHL